VGFGEVQAQRQRMGSHKRRIGGIPVRASSLGSALCRVVGLTLARREVISKIKNLALLRHGS